MDNGVVRVFAIACLTAVCIYFIARSDGSNADLFEAQKRSPILVSEVKPKQVKFPRPAQPRTNPGSWLNTHDYPASALIGELEGVVRFRVDVDPFGEVSKCEITQSSGIEVFDNKVCAAISTRARFFPAYDENQRPVPGSFSSSVRWQIPR